jgi:hypothetical protein
MAVKPVKVLTDLLTRKQVIKQDLDGNILFRISGTLNNGTVSSSLPITASFFVGDGRYLTNISASSGGGASTSVVNANYKKLRYKVTGTFDAEGYAEEALPLTQYGSASFPVADQDYFIINLMVKESGSANWANDIIAYELFTSASQVYVGMYAPDIATSGSYKLLAINENPTAYDVS